MMKNLVARTVLAFAAILASASSSAEEVPASALNALGLGGLQQMPEAEAAQVRGSAIGLGGSYSVVRGFLSGRFVHFNANVRVSFSAFVSRPAIPTFPAVVPRFHPFSFVGVPSFGFFGAYTPFNPPPVFFGLPLFNIR